VIDVLVVGGGPAGCAAATLLARWGHQVTLVTRRVAGTPALGESIPPSTRKLLDVLGVRGALDAADFIHSTGNTVWWGSEEPRIERFGSGAHGWQVTTTALESLLRAHASAAGVEVRVASLRPDAAAVRDAAFVLDCSGRRGVFARGAGLRIAEPDFRTIAMVGVWTAPAFDVPDATHTLIVRRRLGLVSAGGRWGTVCRGDG
jgi:2-polyprenyl-6-methoxyphenol hydroxylase-like FAD-dependent oxidoreductase